MKQAHRAAIDTGKQHSRGQDENACNSPEPEYQVPAWDAFLNDIVRVEEWDLCYEIGGPKTNAQDKLNNKEVMWQQTTAEQALTAEHRLLQNSVQPT